MATIVLQPCYSLNQTGDTLTVTDNTGEYSSINTGGWGSPNPIVSTALVSHVDISVRAADGTFGEITSVNSFPDLPCSNGCSFDISSEDAGQGTAFADAIYKFNYYVSGTSGTPYIYNVITYKSFHPNIDCCYVKLSAKLSACNCGCEELTDKFNKMTINMMLLEKAECNGDLQSIQSYLDCLKKICTECDCNCNQ